VTSKQEGKGQDLRNGIGTAGKLGIGFGLQSVFSGVTGKINVRLSGIGRTMLEFADVTDSGRVGVGGRVIANHVETQKDK